MLFSWFGRRDKRVTTSRLLLLPRELRNQIYETVFVDIADRLVLNFYRPKAYSLDSLWRWDRVYQHICGLSLLHVCTQIRHEASPYVYHRISALVSPEWAVRYSSWCDLFQFHRTLRKALEHPRCDFLLDPTHIYLGGGSKTLHAIVAPGGEEIWALYESGVERGSGWRKMTVILVAGFAELRKKMAGLRRITIRAVISKVTGSPQA